MSSTKRPRILVTGSRTWENRERIAEALQWARSELGGDPILVHGACPSGADRIADEIWSEWGFSVERHPADWVRFGRGAGPRRNQQMVDLGADIVLAFPVDGSRGTQDCIRRARNAGCEVVVFDQSDPEDF